MADGHVLLAPSGRGRTWRVLRPACAPVGTYYEVATTTSEATARRLAGLLNGEEAGK